MTVILNAPIRYWKCPSCDVVDRTQIAEVHSRFHDCAAMGNVSLPLMEVLHPDDVPNARHVLIEREDYVGDEVGVGRYMAVRTVHGSGAYDQSVFAPTAVVSVSGL